jgi:hypothetical protein
MQKANPNQKSVLHQSSPKRCFDICWSSQILVTFSQAIQAVSNVEQSIDVFSLQDCFGIGWIINITLNIIQDGKWTWPTPNAHYWGDKKLSYKSWCLSQSLNHGLKLTSRCFTVCGIVVSGINCAVWSKAFFAVIVLAVRLVKTMDVQMVFSQEEMESKWL